LRKSVSNISFILFFYFRDFNYIIVDSKTYKINTDMIEKILPGKQFREVTCTGKARGNTITEM
jgi:hypothetical protein